MPFKQLRSVKRVAFDRSNYLDDQQRSHTTQINDVEGVPLLKNYVPFMMNKHKAHAMLDSWGDISVADISVFESEPQRKQMNRTLV